MLSVSFSCILWEKKIAFYFSATTTCSLAELLRSSHILGACIVQYYSFDRFDKGHHLGSDFLQW